MTSADLNSIPDPGSKWTFVVVSAYLPSIDVITAGAFSTESLALQTLAASYPTDSQEAEIVRAAYLAMKLVTWYVIVPFSFVPLLLTGPLLSLGMPWVFLGTIGFWQN